MYPVKPSRPIGVTLAAVLLGIFSGLLVLGALGTVLVSLMAKTLLAAQPAPGATAPPPGVLGGVLLGIAMVYLLLAGWGISTTVGLVRLRNWARISIIIIGAGLVLLGIFSVLGTVMAQHLMASGQVPTTGNPAALRVILLFYCVLWLLVIASGLWFIIYFAIRSTRDVFRAAAQPALTAEYEGLPTPYAAQPASFGAQDFYYAEPAATAADPLLAAVPYAPPPYATAPPLAAPKSRPVSMVIVGILLILGGLSQIVLTFIAFPFLFFGVVLHGAAAKIVLAVLALATIYAGIGLIKLWKPAWITAVAIIVISGLNCMVSILPGNIDKMRDISHQFSARVNAHMGFTPTPTANAMQPMFEGNGFFRIMFLFSLALLALYFILLWRARWAYEPGALQPTESPSSGTTV